MVSWYTLTDKISFCYDSNQVEVLVNLECLSYNNQDLRKNYR